MSKLGKQPLCNGCTTLTVSLAQMTTVWPGPRHLYFVTLTPSAAVFRSPLIFFFFLPPLFTPPPRQSGQLVLCCAKGCCLSSVMCDSLTVSPLGKGPSAANKQQSPRDWAGDSRQPDFTGLASRVYYKRSEVRPRLIISGEQRRRGWLEGEGGWRMAPAVAPVSSQKKKVSADGFWELGIHTCNASLKACRRRSRPFIMLVKIINLIHPQEQLVADGIHPRLVPLCDYLHV